MDSKFGDCQTRKLQEDECQPLPPAKRQRTVEDFFTFCKFILEYENYEAIKQEELRQKSSSPDGSTSSNDTLSLVDSGIGNSSLQDQKTTDVESDEDSYDLITCFCMKPFAGRPMIECSECLTWIHLSCAKIRKSNIPDEFVCQRCRQSKASTRKSRRIGGDSQTFGT